MSGDKIRGLSCSNCGAPLAGQEDDDVVRCAHCGKRHASIYPPPAITSASVFKKGDAVAVNWGGKWWPARVTSESGSSGWIIQYDGWGPTFKEEVGVDRIRSITAGPVESTEETPRAIAIEVPPNKRSPSTATIAGGVSLLALGAVLGGYLLWPSSESAGGDLSDNDIQSQAAAMGGIEQMPPDSSPVTDKNTLVPGRSVYILWEHAWFPGEVVAVDGNRVRVHYDGWDEAYDETVTTTRLRLKKR